jgi:RNA recognition motif-containing protein
MNIYVGNLPKTAKNQDLLKLFEPYGKVVSAAIARDKRSGESRGFAFVEMASRHEGEEAIAALNETEFEGQKLHVNEARPREEHGHGPAGKGQSHGGERWDRHQRGSGYHGRGGGFNRGSMGQRGGRRGG